MKTKSHKYKHGGRITNPYTFIFATMILCIWLVSENNHYDDVYVREPDVYMKPVVVEHPEDESVETKIRKYFPRSHKTMIAIAKAESGLNNNAKNWNCYYYQGKATTTKIVGGSKACKVEDRHLSWSVDCFVLQANYPGRKTCPNVGIDQHLQEMADLTRKRKFEPWVAYQLKMHLEHLANN